MRDLLEKFECESPPRKYCSYQVIKSFDEKVNASIEEDRGSNETGIVIPKI